MSDPPFPPESSASDDGAFEMPSFAVPAIETPTSEHPVVAPAPGDPASRAARWAERRGHGRRLALAGLAVVVVAAAVGTAFAVSGHSDGSSSSGPGRLAAAHTPTTPVASTSDTKHPSKSTTSTTTPTVIHQPKAVVLPAVPAGGLSWGSSGPVVAAIQRRMKKLHFDPGKIDGEYGQDTNYAVTTVDKLLGLPRDGVITPAVAAGLEHFKYTAAMPKAEPNRVEINLDDQVLTVFDNYQPILITTTSTGSGEHFCGGSDGCQYAITPAGHFHFQYLHTGWDQGKLGAMWNPYFFDGGIAVHGLQSVPAYPASHGCARIPMDIANYFPSLVTKGESVYVVGTPMKAGDLYVGPAPVTTTTTPKTTTTAPGHKKRKHHPTTTTTPRTPTTPTTAATTPTTAPKAPTTTAPKTPTTS